MKEDKQVTSSLETIDPITGKPPASRVATPNMAQAIARRFRDADQDRAIRRAKIEGQLGGNAPYNDEMLKKAGQSDKSNVAFREGEGHVNARKSTYYNLIFDVPCLVSCTLKNPKLRDRNYAGSISQAFHDMLYDWPGFMYNIMLHQDEMVKHGIGPVYWPDVFDWKFKSIKNGSFLVDSAVDSNIDTIPNAVIRGQYQAHELFWKFYATDEEISAGITDAEKQKIAAEHGWDFELTNRLIIEANKTRAAKKGDQYSTSIWESIQQQVRNADTVYSNTDSDIIFVDHVFVKEFRGKWSWYIVPEDNADVQYIFKSPNVYEHLAQVVCLFFANIGDGSYHSVKGMGTKIFTHCAINDRVKNGMIDSVNLKNTLVVQGDVSDVRRIKIGRCTVIPNNVKIVPNAFGPDIQGSIEVSNFLEKSLARNVGTDRPDIDNHEGKSMETATGERIRLSREGKLERTDIMFYYQQLDGLYREIKRRMFEVEKNVNHAAYQTVKKFKEDCIAAGVPESLLNDSSFRVEATRAIGFGSPAQARQIMSEVVSLAGHFPEEGKVNAVRDYTSVLVGHRMVDRYIPEDNSAQDPSNQTSFAVLENSMMEQGGRVAIGRDQLHLVHIEVHLEPIEQIAKQFVATGGLGDNPLHTHDFFMGDLHHIAEHMDTIKDDPTRKSEYGGFMKRFDELTKVYGAIGKMVKKFQDQLAAERQQRMQPPQDPAVAAKLAKVQADQQVDMQREADMQKIREAKANHGMMIKSQMAEHKMNLDNQKEGM